MASNDQMKVEAFKTAERKGVLEADAQFSFIIISESIDRKHQNQFARNRGINTSGRKADYAFSYSDEIKVELMLDNTISYKLMSPFFFQEEKSIKKTVDNYMKYCFYMDGDIHESRFLRISWGDSQFDCRLKSVNVAYSVFNDDGIPMRAKLDCVFVEDISDKKRSQKENKKSPDISHSRIVLQGQTLTGLTKEVYGNAAPYLMVAQVNKLDHFRRLEPGTKLYFPPLIK